MPTSLLMCSFCHKSQDAVAKLIGSPRYDPIRVYICEECVAVCNSILEDDRSATPPQPVATSRQKCSFCQKPSGEVKRVMSSPSGELPVYICDKCVWQMYRDSFRRSETSSR